MKEFSKERKPLRVKWDMLRAKSLSLDEKSQLLSALAGSRLEVTKLPVNISPKGSVATWAVRR
jgi:hypothetical protein